MDTEELKFAIDDINTRQSALIELTKFNDQQAMSLLNLYVTLGIAAIGAALSGTGSAPLIGQAPAAALATFALVIFMGAVECHRSMNPSAVPLPGRGADYWNAIRKNERWTFEYALTTYMEDAEGHQKAFLRSHELGAARLVRGRQFGLLAVGCAASVGLITALCW